MRRELISDTSRVPITISIRRRPRRPSLRVGRSFDRVGRAHWRIGLQSLVVLVAICDVLPLMNSNEPTASPAEGIALRSNDRAVTLPPR